MSPSLRVATRSELTSVRNAQVFCRLPKGECGCFPSRWKAPLTNVRGRRLNARLLLREATATPLAKCFAGRQ